MKDELFPFQKIAVGNLRKLTAVALRNYRDIHVPQVISLQAPTGAGKTIIMAEKGFDATTITQEDVDNYGI